MSSIPLNKIRSLESRMVEILNTPPGWHADTRAILDSLSDVANDLDANEGVVTNAMRIKVLLGVADLRKVSTDLDAGQQSRINGVILAFREIFP